MRWVISVVLFLALLWPASTPLQARDLNASRQDEGRVPGFDGALSYADTLLNSYLRWPTGYAVQNTGLVRASFRANGTFGAAFGYGPSASDGWPVVGFEVPPGSGVEYLFGGAIWVGGIVGEDTLVSVGADGWLGIAEMFPDVNGAGITPTLGPGDQSFRAEFTDTVMALAVPDPTDGRPHHPLDIRIANRSHIWRSQPADAIVMYDLVLTNIGPEPVAEGYIGFYFDADVMADGSANGGYADDLTGSLRENGIAYIIDNDGDLLNPGVEPTPRAFAFKLLDATFPVADTNYNWWIPNGTASLDFGPRLKPTASDPFRDFGTGGTGTPENDRNKYYLLSHAEWDYDQVQMASIEADDSLWLLPPTDPVFGHFDDYADGYDMRFLMSFGPFDLAPGQSERLLAATFTTDTIHVLADNAQTNLPHNPAAYLANLDLSSMEVNAGVADSLVGSVLDPLSAPMGLHVLEKEAEQALVGWDAYCYGGVEGYDLLIEPSSPASWPYPGVIPPWLSISPGLSPAVSLPSDATAHLFDGLSSDQWYLVSIAHRTASGTGSLAPAISLAPADRAPAPEVPMEYLFVPFGSTSVDLQWTAPSDVAVDHYNIYRFDSLAQANRAYHAFYDNGYMTAWIPPADSFMIDGEEYFYYAMQPHQVVAGGTTQYSDSLTPEGTAYVVTAVDETGLESHFSMPMEVVHTPLRNKDILVLTRGTRSSSTAFLSYPAVVAFYDSILAGYDYDIYSWADSNVSGIIRTDLHLLMEYDLVVIDDDLSDICLNQAWETSGKAYTKCLLSGGKIAYFGAFIQPAGFEYLSGPPQTKATPVPFPGRFFAIDSISHMPAGYLWREVYGQTTTGYADTVCGFTAAVPALPGLPQITYDVSRGRIGGGLLPQSAWPINAALSVATYVPGAGGEVMYTFGADPNVGSSLEGLPVGVHSGAEGTECWAFGFHLWYMEATPARQLVEALIEGGLSASLDSDTAFIYQLKFVGDPPEVTVFLGNIRDGHTVADILPSSIRINETILPNSIAIESGIPGFNGDVLAVRIPLVPILSPLVPLYGTISQPLALSGEYGDGAPIEVTQTLIVRGKTVGDLNQDQQVNIGDAIVLIDHLFRGGHQELTSADLDLNGDCSCSIGDLTALVNFLFKAGTPLTDCPE